MQLHATPFRLPQRRLWRPNTSCAFSNQLAVKSVTGGNPLSDIRRLPIPWITVTIVGSAWFLFLTLQSPTSLAFQLESPDLLRLLSCHLIHWSFKHLLWDTITFFILGAFSEIVYRKTYQLFLLVAVLVVPVFVSLIRQDITHYAGLSGLVIGQVAMALACRLDAAIQKGDRFYLIVLCMSIVLLLAKQVYECIIGCTTVMTIDYRNFQSIPEAHIISVIVGLWIGLNN